jgi:hypothetical protein
MSARTLALLLLAGPFIASSARADTRPLLTEEATTGPAGRIVLETGIDFIKDEPNFLTGGLRDRWDGPLLRVVYSPANNVEMDLEWVTRVIVRGDPDFGNVSDSGDVTLRAKVRFVEGGERRPTVGARFTVTLAETSFGNGLGPNTLRAQAQMLVTQPVGKARLHGNAGLMLFDEVLRPHEQRDFFSYGVALGLPLRDRLELVGEVAGRAGKGSPGAEERSEVRAGVRYALGSVKLDTALRRGLADADGTWGFTAGLAWTIRDRQ